MKTNRFAIVTVLCGCMCTYGCVHAQIDPAAQRVLSEISYENNSAQWQKRNKHLVPGIEETQEILCLNQERDFKSNDCDGDGVVNMLDPSPFDWRETGYQPFGILAFLSWDHEWNNYKYDLAKLRAAAELLKETGIAYVRMDFIWEDIEPYQDTFNFDKYDYIVNLLAEHNIRILGILGYSASWAGPQWNAPPSDFVDFTDFVKNVIMRYKDTIKYWEIWNEPDSRVYWYTQDEMKTYAELLKLSCVCAKEIDPTCKIVLGGMTSGGYYALQNVYRNAGKDYFDIINMHPFINPLREGSFNSVFSLYRNIKRLQKRFDDEEKKIWFTEIGCPGVTDNQPPSGWWEGSSPSEAEQAQFLDRVYTKLIPLADVEKIFWAYFRDNKEHFKSGVDYFGIIRWDLSTKPTYEKLRGNFLRWHKFYEEEL